LVWFAAWTVSTLAVARSRQRLARTSTSFLLATCIVLLVAGSTWRSINRWLVRSCAGFAQTSLWLARRAANALCLAHLAAHSLPLPFHKPTRCWLQPGSFLRADRHQKACEQ